MPLLSIVIPAMSRASLLQDSIASTLNQDYGDFELIVSNNGADADVRAAVSPFLADPRLRYVEQPDVLDMVTHWERVTREINGEYLLILTNRCVFKQGAFRRVVAALQDTNAEFVSWPWDSYYDKFKLYLPFRAGQGQTRVLDVDHELACGTHQFYTLPRGLNSCVSRALIDRIRARQGQAFRTLNPDFTFAYSCLLNSRHGVYIEEPLFIFQGHEVSNAGGLGGDLRPYLRSLGLAEPLKDTPIKAPLVANTILQDFLAAVREYQRPNIEQQFNRAQFYLDCLDEIDRKRSKGSTSSADLKNWDEALQAALGSESNAVQNEVRVGRRSLGRLATRLRRRVRDRYGNLLFYWLYLRGASAHATVLDAAGFQSDKSGAQRPGGSNRLNVHHPAKRQPNA